jgi:hypothetical protein
MKKLKAFRRKWFWPNKYTMPLFAGQTEGNHKDLCQHN